MPEKLRLTPEEIIEFRALGDAHISPDGVRVAFVVGDYYKVDTKSPRSQVWVVPAEGGEARPYTWGERTDNQPRWSPDSKALAFVSDRKEDGKPQLYLLREGGGEAEALTDLNCGIHSPAWSLDGGKIAFLAEDPETEQEKKRREAKDDTIEFEQNPRFTRVWTVDLATREVKPLTKGNIQVWEYGWSPDGQRLALVASDLPFEYSWYQSRLATVDALGGEPVSIYEPDPPPVPSAGGFPIPRGRQIAHPGWSPDGRSISFITCTWSDRGVVAGDVCLIPAGGGEVRNLTEGQPLSVSWTEWLPNGDMLVAACQQGEQALAIITAQGELKTLWREQAMFEGRWQPRFSLSGDGKIAAIKEDPQHPAQVWVTPQAGAEWRQLTEFNEKIQEFALPRVETLHWKGRDGLDIQGLLVRPPDAGGEEGKPLPLVLYVHGGPTGLYSYCFYSAGSLALIGLLASKGMAVLLPNPRGSAGWGRPFAEANLGDMGGEDYFDIMAGVDLCVQRGMADKNRLGVGGWSYGGFMTAWIVTQTDRFKAAVVGAGVTNWRSFHGVSNLPTWDALYYQADPYEVGGRYDRFSPITHVEKVRTPTLLAHGEADPYVPVGQAYEFYRALKELGRPVELAVYPRESHGFREKLHVLDLQNRSAGWFERWLEP